MGLRERSDVRARLTNVMRRPDTASVRGQLSDCAACPSGPSGAALGREANLVTSDLRSSTRMEWALDRPGAQSRAHSATDWLTVLVIEPGRLGQSQLRRATGRCVVRGPLTGHCQRVQKSSG